LLTIDFMVRKGIIHRDLKPENILLNSKSPGNYDIRIADFGFATFFNTKTYEPVDVREEGFVLGTPGYIAPESLNSKGYK